jgi:hypothetical protein
MWMPTRTAPPGREGVVDLGGGGIVDRERRRRGQRQRLVRGPGIGQRRVEAGAARETARQEAFQVPGVGRGDRAARQQQPQRRRFQFVRGLLDRLVLGRIAVGAQQQPGAERADRLGQAAGHEVGDVPGALLFLRLAAGHRRQRRLQHVGRRRAEASLGLAVEVQRGAMHAQQDGRGLHRAGLVSEVVAREVLEAEFLLRRALPEEVQVDSGRLQPRLLEQLRAGRPLEAQQHVAGLDLAAPAPGQLDLERTVGRRQHRADLQVAFLLEQKLHRRGGRNQTVSPPATSITAPLM